LSAEITGRIANDGCGLPKIRAALQTGTRPAAKFFPTLPRESLNRLRANRQLYAFPDAGRLTKIHTKIAVEENILSGSRSEAEKATRTSDLDG